MRKDRKPQTPAEVTADFARVVRESTPKLYRVAACIAGSVADAEDVLQESFLRACLSLREHRFDGTSTLQTWLYRIVVNACLDSRRADRRRQQREERAFEWNRASDPRDELEARAALREVAEWMDGMPLEHRVALVLKEIDGRTTPEIAAVLACSEGAVEQRLVRARAYLRDRRSE
ncbi:MAG TPA: sigma-70 family RNA polymerase sigma factor [Polyangiaceae bacterium]